MAKNDDKVTGYKTMIDKTGRRYHVPFTDAEAAMLWKKLEAQKVTCAYCDGNGAISMGDYKIECNQCGGQGKK